MNIDTYKEEYIGFIKDSKDIGKTFKLNEDFEEIFICGMGGSGIAGMIFKSLIKNKRITTVNTDELPFYANEKSLVFVISYSGNTEEMTSIYNQAIKQKCQIVAITSGGNIRDKTIRDGLKYIRIPSKIQPRMALPYLIIPIMNVLKISFDPHQLVKILEHKAITEKAKDLAEKLENKIPMIYSSDRIYPVAYRWKTQFNENTKIHAFANKFSELNHNELEGYEKLNGEYYVIMIRDENDSIKHVKRMELTKKLIMDKKVPVTEISIKGKSSFNRVMTEIFIGDLTSIFLANRYEIDVEPVKLIEDFKKELKK
ncbi:bifunctional phosphoglucose/phosphomannose isomerase [Candidatus Woesearchaeota archaeon]|nr:bifunctional phosphoglucose/phosphomannose isomerase [Candidatus Woesearchaeota archaeon]